MWTPPPGLLVWGGADGAGLAVSLGSGGVTVRCTAVVGRTAAAAERLLKLREPVMASFYALFPCFEQAFLD